MYLQRSLIFERYSCPYISNLPKHEKRVLSLILGSKLKILYLIYDIEKHNYIYLLLYVMHEWIQYKCIRLCLIFKAKCNTLYWQPLYFHCCQTTCKLYIFQKVTSLSMCVWMVKQNLFSFNIFRWGKVKRYIKVEKCFHTMYIANNARRDCRFVYGFIFN